MILQLGLKELRSLWHDKVLLFFAIWAFSFGIYSAATAVSMGASVEDSVPHDLAAGAHTRHLGLRGRVRNLRTSLSSGGAVPWEPALGPVESVVE